MPARITNITGHVELNGKLNIKKLVLKCPEIKHSIKRRLKRKKEVNFGSNCLIDKERAPKTLYQNETQKGFNSVVLSIPTSVKKVTALCYPSGKLILIGANSDEVLEEAVIGASLLLKKSIKGQLKISNYAGSGELCPPFGAYELGNLCKEINQKHGTMYSAIFEPEIFPGLMIEIKNTKIKCRIFKKGTANITGAKSNDEMIQFFEQIKSLVISLKNKNQSLLN